MAVFALENGRLVGAPTNPEIAEEMSEEVLGAVREQALDLIDRPLFAVGRITADARGNNQESLICLDVTGQVVTVEVMPELDSHGLIASLARAGRNSDKSRSQLADLYPHGAHAFGIDWAAFIESSPPSTSRGPRLFLFVTTLAKDVLQPLAALAGLGVEAQQVIIHRGADGLLIELSNIGAARNNLLPASSRVLEISDDADNAALRGDDDEGSVSLDAQSLFERHQAGSDPAAEPASESAHIDDILDRVEPVDAAPAEESADGAADDADDVDKADRVATSGGAAAGSDASDDQSAHEDNDGIQEDTATTPGMRKAAIGAGDNKLPDFAGRLEHEDEKTESDGPANSDGFANTDATPESSDDGFADVDPDTNKDAWGIDQSLWSMPGWSDDEDEQAPGLEPDTGEERDSESHDARRRQDTAIALAEISEGRAPTSDEVGTSGAVQTSANAADSVDASGSANATGSADSPDGAQSSSDDEIPTTDERPAVFAKNEEEVIAYLSVAREKAEQRRLSRRERRAARRREAEERLEQVDPGPTMFDQMMAEAKRPEQRLWDMSAPESSSDKMLISEQWSASESTRAVAQAADGERSDSEHPADSGGTDQPSGSDQTSGSDQLSHSDATETVELEAIEVEPIEVEPEREPISALVQIAERIGAPVALRWHSPRRGIDETATLTAEGYIDIDGSLYIDPSDAAEAATGTRVDGWRVWQVDGGARLGDLR